MTAPQPAVCADDLAKTFRVPERDAGVGAAVRSLFHRRTRDVVAVKGVTFRLEPGEIVGFLGPNGAGKTTTLKMLSGLLHPTGGQAAVLGHVPWKREKALLRRITLVMGNRNQMQWDLPALDSFALNASIYRLPPAEFTATRDELIALMDVGDLVTKPVRNLSLGERMKMEFIAALLHRPQVLFLDEPTIGLDVTAQRTLRQFVAEYNRRTGATVLLTSHYMADVQALCKRVLVIHHGSLLYDGELKGLGEQFAAYKTLGITLEGDVGLGAGAGGGAVAGAVGGPGVDWAGYGEVVAVDGPKVTIQVPRAAASRIASRVLAELPVADLTIEDPPIDEVIARVFAAGADGAAAADAHVDDQGVADAPADGGAPVDGARSA
ncbi:MAG: ABC transporter ATP-binding protein [Ardenticatenales bacterium]